MERAFGPVEFGDRNLRVSAELTGLSNLAGAGVVDSGDDYRDRIGGLRGDLAAD